MLQHDAKLQSAATRSDMRAKNLIHRCSFTMIFNSQGELYVQKRVAFKETYASHYDPAPGGVVGEGETYEENAVREIEEEMGVTGVNLERQFDFFYSDNVCRLWGRLFRCQYEGPFKLDPEEVESGQFMSLEEVADLLRSGPVCPDSKAAVAQYLQLHSSEA
ncbi:Uncharacterized Nudix hydrolase YfcD [Coccomyxa sp. Obi]|nr:Uncharacterized Nudix hydrolase YfcD [Coccomyxa sp. Obi]